MAYAEPSYGRDDAATPNPNRMQTHTQYQVILKPAPADSRSPTCAAWRRSASTGAHDIRFVEDNWESLPWAPRVGLGGLAGRSRDHQVHLFPAGRRLPAGPRADRVHLGPERIVMYLQGVKEVWQIDWDGRRTYGDVLRLPEIEHCNNDFKSWMWRACLKAMYDLFEAEAKNCLAHRLVIPANDKVLRCSHTFNLLDARGVIGVTERAYYFARMRDLARQVSIAYVEQREHEGYPWLGVGGSR